MKKFALVMAILALSSSVAMAADPMALTNPDQIDGKNVVAYPANPASVIDNQGYADQTGAREGTLPQIWGNQSVSADILVQAFIPCFLEMKFQGNDTNTLLQVWGKDQTVSDNSATTEIAFHPNVGGYVDANWNYIGNSTTSLAEVGIDQAWVRACDTFRSIIWSNDDYKYSVRLENGALQGVGTETAGHTLPVEMRASVNAGQSKGAVQAFADVDPTTWAAVNLASGTDQVLVPGVNNHNTQTTVYQQFRVPFGSSVKAGSYSGRFYATAGTI